MKKYLVKFTDGHELEVYASSAANAEQIAIGTAARTSGRPQAEIAETIAEVSPSAPCMKTTKEIIEEYVAENGPTTAQRISRDTGIPEAEIAAATTRWEQRSSLDGPGKNYVAG